MLRTLWPWRRGTPLIDARWVVIDCETSGLDVSRDRLLSVGAVAVRAGRIELAEHFAELVAQPEPSARDNVLVHGIGGDAQRSGRAQAEVVAELERFLGEGLAVGFHAPFDAAVLERAGLRRRRWLDLEPLAGALHPAQRLHSLDEWLAAHGIEHPARHDALLDALASAELFLVLLAEGRRQGLRTVEEVIDTARSRRWLAP